MLSVRVYVYSIPGIFPILLHLFLIRTPGGRYYYEPYCLDMEMSIKELSLFAQGHAGK